MIKQPLVSSHVRHVIPLSILSVDREERAKRFIMNEYIDVVFRPWYHWFDFDNHFYDSWDCIIYRRISSDIIKENKINLVSYIVNGLRLNYYSDVWLDAYYIPGKVEYNSMHLTQCILIFGYDKGKDIFNVLTFTAQGVYSEISVSVQDLIVACSNNYFQCVNLLKRNDKSIVEFDVNLILDKLYNYINSIYSYEGNTKYNKKNDEQLCNYKATEFFSTYIVKNIEKENRIALCPLTGFAQHKRCMAWRLRYLCELTNIMDDDVESFIEYIDNQYDLLINMSIKYNATHSNGLISKITHIIDEMVSKEKLAILSLLENLNHNVI